MKWWLKYLLFLMVCASVYGGYHYWHVVQSQRLPAYLWSGNGRIEAEQVNISAKFSGKLAKVFVEEGQMVHAGDVVATLDDAELQAQIRQAKALVAQRESDMALAQSEFKRSKTLHHKGFATTEVVDQRAAQLNSAKAGLDAAKANVASLESNLGDMTLTSPVDGRVEYRLLHTGEMAAAGATVVTVLDVKDVYMVIFVDAAIAGKLAMGGEARLILDPVPEYVIPATITYVASEAQFTPKTVETKDERSKLMFRVKVNIPRALLEKHAEKVKTGVRGVAYLMVDKMAIWPEHLAVKVPQ